MTRRKIAAILLLFVFLFPLVLTACGGGEAATPSPTPTVTSTPAPTPTPEPTPAPDPVRALLDQLTLEQKVGQLLVAGFEGVQPGEDALRAIQEYQVGGLILYDRNVESTEQLAELTNALKALNGEHIPLFLSMDEEGGRVSRMPPEITDLPSALTFGDVEGEELRLNACYGLGGTLAGLCKAFGISLNYAPVLDVWSNPDNTVIGSRAFGTDAMGEAAVLALEAGCDLLLVCHGAGNLTAAREGLLAAVESGRISQKRLDESVYRILSLKLEYAVTNDPVPQPDAAELNQTVDQLLELLP